MITLERVGTLCAIGGLPPDLEARVKEELVYEELSYQMVRGRPMTIATPVRMWDHQLDGRLVFMSGYATRVAGLVEAAGLQIDSYVRRDRTDLSSTIPNVRAAAQANLRPEQVELLRTMVGYEDGQLAAGTGVGKSWLMRAACQVFPEARIVICAPSAETVRTLTRYIKEEQGDNVGQVGAGSRHTRRVTVSTYDSVLHVDQIDKCDILIVDECHRAAAKCYARDFAAIQSPLKRFGLTATPDGRFDKAEWLTEGLFGPVRVNLAYQDSVQSGSVLPIHVLAVENPYGPSPDVIDQVVQQVKRDRIALWRNDGRNRLIAQITEQIRGKYQDAQTLILVDKIEHALVLKQLLPDYVLFHGDIDEARVTKLSRQLGDVRELLMSQSQRAAMLGRFESGELKRVIGTAILGTGVSANECQIVMVAGGSGATIAFRQSIGRASRKSEGKTHAVAIVPVDSFHRSYRARALKLVASAKKEGHIITRLTEEEVQGWSPPQAS